MKQDRCDHAKKYSQELVTNGLSFLTESGRVLEGGLFERGGLFNNSRSKGGACSRGGFI